MDIRKQMPSPKPGQGCLLHTIVVLRRERCYRRDAVITVFSHVDPWELTLGEERSL